MQFFHEKMEKNNENLISYNTKDPQHIPTAVFPLPCSFPLYLSLEYIQRNTPRTHMCTLTLETHVCEWIVMCV